MSAMEHQVGDTHLVAVPTEKCVGAFLRPCDNQTATILCADCYDLVDRTMNQTRRSVPVRFKHQPRHT